MSRRPKPQILQESTELDDLAKSDAYQKLMSMARAILTSDLQLMLSADLKANEILDIVLQARGLYRLIKMLPAEQDALADELERIERQEKLENQHIYERRMQDYAATV